MLKVIIQLYSYLKDTASKAWSAIRKVPGWVVFSFLLLSGVVYYYATSLSVARKKLEVRVKQAQLQEERDKVLKSIDESEKDKVAEVTAKYEKGLARLSQREKELDRLSIQGPVEIAKAWREYLSK